MSNQPAWQCIANLGDATPEEHDGAFVMIDKRGVYTPELWIVTIDEEYPDDNISRLCRTQIDLCYQTGQRYSVSDNKYHMDHEAWFGGIKSIASIASTIGTSPFEFVSLLCSLNVVDRAGAYLDLVRHWGVSNFGGEEKLAGLETRSLCAKALAQIKDAEAWEDGFKYDRLTDEMEREIHRAWSSGNYAQAYSLTEVDDDNQFIRNESEPEEDTQHWAYVLGYFSSFEEEEMPEWAVDLYYENKGTLNYLGISTE